MKRMLALILAMTLLLTTIPVLAEESGIWEERQYVDEFELPTGDTYVSNKYPIVGKFSNSATTDSSLEVYLFYDKGVISLRLIEYGSYIVKNSYSKAEEYKVSLMDPQGARYSLTGSMSSKSDMLRFDEDDSKTIVKALCQNGLVRFSIQGQNSKYLFNISDSTGFIDFMPFNSLLAFSEGLAWGEKEGKWGAIDATGKTVIPFEWDYANSFSDGLAFVNKSGMLSYIDTTGKSVIPCEWDSANNFIRGHASVKLDNKWGFIDTTGTLVIPCEWDKVGSFSEGLFNVKKADKWGYIDATGKVVIPFEWDSAGIFIDGIALAKKADQYGFIDTTGKLVISCGWDEVGSFSEGLAYVQKEGKYGFIDTTGKLVIPCEWDYVGNFSEGLAYVQKAGKYGFIDTTGKLVIPCEWDDAGKFSEGLASVTKSGKSGYIDITGKLIIPCEWGAYPTTFSEGFASVNTNKGNRVMIDVKGNIVIE